LSSLLFRFQTCIKQWMSHILGHAFNKWLMTWLQTFSSMRHHTWSKQCNLFQQIFKQELPYKAKFLAWCQIKKKSLCLGCVKDSPQSGQSVSRGNTWHPYGQQQKASSQINVRVNEGTWNTANNNKLPFVEGLTGFHQLNSWYGSKYSKVSLLLIQYSVLSIIQGNGAEGFARIIDKHGSSKTCSLLSHKQKIKL
jgi:hypothetical protein